MAYSSNMLIWVSDESTKYLHASLIYCRFFFRPKYCKMWWIELVLNPVMILIMYEIQDLD